MSALTTFRHDNLPTRLEVLRLEQSPRPAFWSELGTAASTDDFAGVAWVSPREYVVPVNQLAHPETSVRAVPRRLRVRGIRTSSTTAPTIDGGQWDVSWPILPGPVARPRARCRRRAAGRGSETRRRPVAPHSTSAPASSSCTDALWTAHRLVDDRPAGLERRLPESRRATRTAGSTRGVSREGRRPTAPQRGYGV